MTAVVERQRWLAVLALALAGPLPLTGIVSWPFMLPYLAVAAWVATSRSATRPLPAWAENLLAPAVVVAVVAAGGVRYGVLRPVAQLAVLLAAVRLPGCGDPRRVRLTAGLVALVGVAGIASSTHPVLAPYLLAVLALVVVAAGRLGAVSLGAPAVGARVPWRLVAATVLVAGTLAAPLFAVLPRLRSPFAVSPFTGRPTSGFRSLVALHGGGEIGLSRRIVLRARFPGVAADRVSPDWLRLAGATLTHYRAGGWVGGVERGDRLIARAGRPITLTGRRAAGGARAEITLEREGRALFVPTGATAIAPPPGVAVVRGTLDTLRMARGTPVPLTYDVWFDPARVVQPPPDDSDVQLPPHSERLRQLAASATRGAGNPLAAALALEQYLQANYTYSLRNDAPLREDPVEWFLFSSRRGHCEFFASSMVLMLRALGIPARLQAGYAGGEREADGVYVVRENNAHAWVLAFVAGGWRVFDPTPPEGRPGVVTAGSALSLGAAWDSLESAWDRWVLTFSMVDQINLAAAAGAAARAARPYLPAAGAAAAAAALLLALARKRARRPRRAAGPGAPAISAALLRLMELATRRGVAVGAATTVREFARAATAAVPRAGGALAWLAREHERCCYAGGLAAPRREVRRMAREAARALSAS